MKIKDIEQKQLIKLRKRENKIRPVLIKLGDEESKRGLGKGEKAQILSKTLGYLYPKM